MNHRKFSPYLICLIIFLLFTPLLAQEKPGQGSVVEKIGEHGQIDWSGGFIYATGIGLPPKGDKNSPYGKTAARQAAIVDAQKNLAEIVYGVRVDSYTSIRDSVLTNLVTKTKVEGLIRGAQPISFKFTKEGTAEATLRLALNGKGTISDVLFPSPEPKIIDNWEIILPPADTLKNKNTVVKVKEVFSGIIINAKGKWAKPSMSPKIFSPDSKLVYGIDAVDVAIAEGNGLVAWSRDPNQAKIHNRVAKHPRVFMVQSISGKRHTDFIVSNEDATVLLSDKNFSFLLHHCKVLILID